MTNWKWIPVEPTEEMFAAFEKFSSYSGGFEEFREDWKLALAAAPTNLSEPFAYYDHFNNVIYHGRTAAEQARKADHGGNTITPLFTAAPRPDLSELRALVEKWREKARCYRKGPLKVVADAIADDADELDAVIERMG